MHSRTPQPYTLEEPLDMEDARAGYRSYSTQRQEARHVLEQRIEDLAVKEKAYRQGRSELRVRCESTTVDDRKTELDALSAQLRFERDLAKGMVDAAHQRLAEIDAGRASFHRLCEWSMRLDPFAQDPTRTQGVKA